MTNSRISWRIRTTAFLVALATASFLLSSCRSDPQVDPNSKTEPGAGSPIASNGSIELEDDGGRKVHLDHPAQRAAVISRYTNELIRAMGSGDKVVAVDKNTSQDRIYWNKFDPEKSFTKGGNDINFELLAAEKVDVLFMSKGKSADAAIAKVKPLGIKVVLVNGFDFINLKKEMHILGKSFGNMQGASKVIDFFNKNINMVKDRIKNVPPKSVYWEYGEPYTTAFPGTWNEGWYRMINTAGGKSIFTDSKNAVKKPGGKMVDPEKILSANPDFIFKTVSGKGFKNTGIYTPPTKEEFAGIAKEMTLRPGWTNLKAIKEDHFYIITGFAEGGLDKMVGVVYLAKWMHPDQMKDIDPDKVFEQWMAMQGHKPPLSHTYHASKS